MSRATTLTMILALTLLVGGCSGSSLQPEPDDEIATVFAADSPWNTRIPTNPDIDPDGAAMVNAIAPRPSLHANLVEFAVPIYAANPTTPEYQVTCRQTTWGQCPFAGTEVPIPDTAQPQPGPDGAVVITDESDKESYELWQAQRQHGTWSVAFGAIHDLQGSGWGGIGASTGSGASRLGGVIRLAEVTRGAIPHALALQTNNACTRAFRPPATKTDGTSDRPDCLPQGILLQLDPSIDTRALDLTPAEKMVAIAMQRYGGYVVDVGGAELSVSFERDPTAGPGQIGKTYTAVGLRWDYDDLSGVPWNELRVVE